MTFRRSLAILLSAVALASCSKNGFQDLSGPVPGSSVKFFNFGVNAPQVNFFANDTKLTAVSSTSTSENPLGTKYGAAAAGGYYVGIDPGQYTLSGRISDTTADHNTAISNVQTTLEDGKYYSYYQSGFYDAAAKTADAFVVEDPIPTQIDYSVAYVRFVNAISNSSPLTLYATGGSGETAIGGAVAYKSAGDFTAVPVGSYSVVARAGTDSTSAARVSFTAGHVYTVSAYGDMSAATTPPTLNNTANW